MAVSSFSKPSEDLICQFFLLCHDNFFDWRRGMWLVLRQTCLPTELFGCLSYHTVHFVYHTVHFVLLKVVCVESLSC